MTLANYLYLELIKLMRQLINPVGTNEIEVWPGGVDFPNVLSATRESCPKLPLNDADVVGRYRTCLDYKYGL